MLTSKGDFSASEWRVVDISKNAGRGSNLKAFTVGELFAEYKVGGKGLVRRRPAFVLDGILQTTRNGKCAANVFPLS